MSEYRSWDAFTTTICIAAIVIKSTFVKTEWDMRKLRARRADGIDNNWDHLFAPLGDRNSIRAMPGELAYYRINADTFTPSGYMANPTTDLITIVDVGGITTDTMLGFAGYV